MPRRGAAPDDGTRNRMKRIAFTFAGRQRMMRNQAVFVRRMLDLGLLDEWHVWNFARDTRDEDWLQRSFSEQLMVYTLGRSDQYVPLRAESAASCRIAVRASNDAVPAAESTATLVLFDSNEIELGIADGNLVLSLNGQPAFSVATSATAVHALEVRTGAGASGQWIAGDPAARITLVNTGLKSQEGFRFAYAHYANARFHGACFVKLDDDIVYCDLERFASFVDDLERDDELKISSANVVNNGVCAHYQGRSGFFAAERFDFEYPKDGVGGTLWESAALCERLHRHFLGHRQEILAVAARQPALTELPRVDRYSINFVGFRYPVMIMMTYLFAVSKVRDDEHLMTVLLPALFGVRKYVFNRLVVSHLSFYKQEETLDSTRLLEAYATLY